MRLYFAVICLFASAPQTLLADSPSQPEMISWEVKDSQNQIFQIPAAKPSILIFGIPDHDATRKGIEQVRGLVREATDFQILLVVSGPDAAKKAQEVCGDGGWRTQIDTDYISSAKFHVVVWPSVVIARADGEIAGHIPSFSPQTPRQLELYMDYARGKVDRAALEKAMRSSHTVEDTPEIIARRRAALAEELLEKGMTEEAVTEIKKALDASPQEPLVQLVYARVLLVQNNGEEVLKVADKIKGDVPAFETAQLRGEAFVLLKRWDEALGELQMAVNLNPKPAQAFYALGIVYQHSGDFAKASEAFQKAYETTSEGNRLTRWLHMTR